MHSLVALRMSLGFVFFGRRRNAIRDLGLSVLLCLLRVVLRVAPILASVLVVPLALLLALPAVGSAGVA